ncbi:hypothetical protein [Tahibacter amnicola]|uniref:Uncharacterized protein n=1 Tax=Tahibacter amnicola TaxID=2976241 RepID=A0ABY6BJ00_9GAMM|nr:hypothetical protein [Tahibacter amnicola]UXI69825.1 hypothetical protein N4264_09425 [Tahibacter amnicola]
MVWMQRLIVLLAGWSGMCGASVLVEIAPDNDAIVVDLRIWSDEVAVADRVLHVRMLADGRVEVHRPFWMRDGGDFTGRLSAAERDGLVQSLLDDGLDTFEREKAIVAVESTSQLRREAGQLSYDSERTHTVFTFNVAAVRRADGRLGIVAQRFGYVNLQLEAERYAAIPALAGAARAQQRVLALARHPSLVHTGGQP